MAHEGYIFVVDGFEVGEVGGGGPLRWCKEVTVEGLGRVADLVVCGEVDLFAVVDGVGCYFGVEAGVS